MDKRTVASAHERIDEIDNWPNLTGPNMDGSGGDWPTEPS